MSTDSVVHADHGHADDHGDHGDHGHGDHGHGDHEHGDHGHGDHVDHPDSYYVKIALVLAGITAAEVTLSYMDIGAAFLPTLLILMAIKFVMVVLFFMHLRFDSKWFNMAFWTGLILAILVYVAALTTFRFFG